MSIKRVSPEDAKQLVDEEGYAYLDVRSIQEFDQGHPEGAYNIPLLHMTPAGMQPNPDFMEVVRSIFEPDAKIVVGCKAGGRSLKAAQAMAQAGYSQVIDQRAGFVGATDPFGQVVEPGWQRKGLPVATRPEPGRSYAELAAKAGKG
jgi:rhodanese-related sulfurtransferase